MLVVIYVQVIELSDSRVERVGKSRGGGVDIGGTSSGASAKLKGANVVTSGTNDRLKSCGDVELPLNYMYTSNTYGKRVEKVRSTYNFHVLG